MYYVLYRDEEGNWQTTEYKPFDECYKMQIDLLWRGVEAHVYPRY